MKRRIGYPVLLLLILFVPCLLWGVTPSGHTRLELTEAGTGRQILSAVLRDGEQVVMTWKNSLFGINVTEVFQAERGALVLNEITFGDPGGPPAPAVAPEDVDDLYHTGGAFAARGLRKPFSHVVFRVSEIGEPKMRVRNRLVPFKEEVGFGGGIVMNAGRARWYEVVL